MRHLQQVLCRRFAQSLRVLFQVLRMTQEAARSDCRFRSPYLDATEQTMSDRSDSHFVQRPSSTAAAVGVSPKQTYLVNGRPRRAQRNPQLLIFT
jgi:hypothetical protein